MRVLVIGLGYVGLTAAVGLASAGHTVVGMDSNPEKAERLRRGELPFYEPDMATLLRDELGSGRLTFANADELGACLCPVVMVAVGTPQRPDGSADLSQVRSVMQTLSRLITSPTTVIMKSTVPPGTGEELRRSVLRQAGAPVMYASNPEFLREGRALYDWFHPDRIVVGAPDEATAQGVLELYANQNAPKIVTSVTEAELIKYCANAFLATKISFINEVANICAALGADVRRVAEGMGTDRRIGTSYLAPGIGYGGSCFPKDMAALNALAVSCGYHFQILTAAIQVNSYQRLWPIRQLRAQFGSLSGRSVAVLGLSFKPGTDDVREAPALDIVQALADAGAAVSVYDPVALRTAGRVLPSSVRQCEAIGDCVAGTEAAVVATEWPEIVGADWPGLLASMGAPKLVVDGRNCLDADQVRACGGQYIGVGTG